MTATYPRPKEFGLDAHRSLHLHVRRQTTPDECRLFYHLLAAFDRLLPHAGVETWGKSHADQKPGAVSVSKFAHIEVRFGSVRVNGMLRREASHNTPQHEFFNRLKALDEDELLLAEQIVEAIDLVGEGRGEAGRLLTHWVEKEFDQMVIARFIEKKHALSFPVIALIRFLQQLAEQSYENRSISYGVIVGRNRLDDPEAPDFPRSHANIKRFKALTDGVKTAFMLATNGKLRKLVDVARESNVGQPERGRWFPDWCRDISLSSIENRCSFALTRHGDILFFDGGTLRLTYRSGQWKYWNHSHIVGLLRGLATVQGVPKKVRERNISEIYRQALDISFRRSGGLYVVLRNRGNLHRIVRLGDAIEDENRTIQERNFDKHLAKKRILEIPRKVMLDIASLDGAIVLANDGELLAYGAVLETKARGAVRKAEGSRTKAAIGASSFGIAVKVSADGDITYFYNGKHYLSI